MRTLVTASIALAFVAVLALPTAGYAQAPMGAHGSGMESGSGTTMAPGRDAQPTMPAESMMRSRTASTHHKVTRRHVTRKKTPRHVVRHTTSTRPGPATNPR
jgi:hypothetical protein